MSEIRIRVSLFCVYETAQTSFKKEQRFQCFYFQFIIYRLVSQTFGYFSCEN